MKRKILIFYQSINEITKIFQIIKKNHFGTCIIIVTGGNHFLHVIEKLKLEKYFGVVVYKFFALSFKNPINILKMYFQLHYSKDSKTVLDYNFYETFFFNKCIDFIAPFFLSKIKTKKITYINLYKFKFSKRKIKLGIIKKIQKIIIKILHKNTNIKMTDFHLIPAGQVFYFYSFGKRIKNIEVTVKNTDSFFKLPLKNRINDNKKIIYIDSKDEAIIGNEFSNIISKIFKIADRKKLSCVIKKHPRFNLSPCFLKFDKLNFILDPMPIELYYLNKVECVIGFNSVSLANIAEKFPKIRVFSIINLLSKKVREEFKNDTLNFYNELTKKKTIHFPRNFKEVENLIKKNDSNFY
jgi:hypothetical protein